MEAASQKFIITLPDFCQMLSIVAIYYALTVTISLPFMKSGKKTTKTILRTSKLVAVSLLGAVQLICQTNVEANPTKASVVSQATSNGKIVFLSSRNLGSNIYIMNADGSGQKRLTQNNSNEGPNLSLDGSKIVFSAMTEVSNHWEIFSMNADGSNVKQLTNNTYNSYHPVWSPDGSKIAFYSYNNSESIYNAKISIMDADGSNQRVLAGGGTSLVSSPTWSPDGRQLAFDRYDYNYDSGAIYIINIDGTNERELLSEAVANSLNPYGYGYGSPSWSPDGKVMAFRVDDIYTVNIDGTNIRQLTYKSGSNWGMSWSPDSTHIAFNSNRATNTGRTLIYKMNADGTGQVLIPGLNEGDTGPSWGKGHLDSPAGQPTANDRYLYVNRNKSIKFTLTGSDPEGKPLTFTGFNGPFDGSVSGTSPNFTYTPNHDFLGEDIFQFKASNGTLESQYANVRLFVSDYTDLSSIGDQFTDENTPTEEIPFTVTDSTTSPDKIIVSANSDNQDLIPVNNITLGGRGANRTIKIKPLPNQTGVANITLSASKAGAAQVISSPILPTQTISRSAGMGTFSISNAAEATGPSTTTFKITVGSANSSPNISPFLKQTLKENSSAISLNFAISDKETPVQNLKVTATSSNQSLFNASSLVLGGYSTQRTLTIKPIAKATGTATLTLKVTDGDGASMESAFQVTVQPLNDPPTISYIGEQGINEGDSINALHFIIEDNQTPTANLTVTASSNNTTLFPAGSIVLGGNDGIRTLKLTPAAYKNGSATITVKVVDAGGLSATSSFLITVYAVNDVPTISAIANRTINEDSTGTSLSFTVGDIETPAANLKVTATSSNQALFNTGSLVLGGQGATRSLTLKPLANASGTATITLKVIDTEGAWTQNSFLITVQPVNDAPTISSIINQSINEGGTTSALPFTIGDIETPAANLTVTASTSNTTLVPTGNIVLGGSGANRTVKLTPAAYQNGNSTITLKVTDGESLSATTSLQITVASVNDAPTISSIESKTIDEDSSPLSIGFTLADRDTSVANLSVTATSSNQSLFNASSLVLGGQGAQRNLTIKPLANANGTSTLTLKVADGAGGLAETSFVVTVKAINDVPTISSITNQIIDEDSSPNALNFTVGDIEPSAANLSVVAISSNLTLFDANSLKLSGQGAQRTLTIKPLPNANGTATITLKVTDSEGAWSQTSFTVTVRPINDTPTISTIANQNTDEDSSLVGLNFTVEDLETPAANLLVTASSSNQSLFNASSLVLSGNGAQRTLSIKPLINASGTATITIKVTDGNGALAQTTFTVTVRPINDAPTISSITNQTIDEDSSPAAMNFTVGDIETSAANLSVVAASSNLTLFDANSLKLNGQGTQRTLTVKPLPNANGAATITLKVTDSEGTSTQTSFVVTVRPINDAPTVQALTANGVVNQPLAITLVGTDIDSNNLTYEIVAAPVTGILSGDGPNLTFIPTVGGTTTFTYRALDPQGAASGTATVSINATVPQGLKASGQVLSYRPNANFNVALSSPVANLRVRLELKGKMVYEVPVDSAGKYTFYAVPTGDYVARVYSLAGNTIAFDPLYQAVKVKKADVALKDFALYSVFGQVINTINNGKTKTVVPVAGATVSASMPVSGSTPITATVITDANGFYVISGFPKGKVTLLVNKTGVTMPSKGKYSVSLPSSSKPNTPNARYDVKGTSSGSSSGSPTPSIQQS